MANSAHEASALSLTRVHACRALTTQSGRGPSLNECQLSYFRWTLLSDWNGCKAVIFMRRGERLFRCRRQSPLGTFDAQTSLGLPPGYSHAPPLQFTGVHSS